MSSTYDVATQRRRLSVFPHASLANDLSLAMRRTKVKPVEISVTNFDTGSIESPMFSSCFQSGPPPPPPTPAEAQAWAQNVMQQRKLSVINM